MGRHRTPDNLLLLRGTHRRDRHGDPTAKPQGAGEIGQPPRHMSAEARRAWKEIAGQAPAGVLTGSDRIALEVAATLLVEFRADPAGMVASRVSRLESLLSRMGMTPADRGRLNLPQRQRRNEFDDL